MNIKQGIQDVLYLIITGMATLKSMKLFQLRLNLMEQTILTPD